VRHSRPPSAVLIMPPIGTDGGLQCTCGNIFVSDARFCRMCGQKRPAGVFTDAAKMQMEQLQLSRFVSPLDVRANIADPRLTIDRGRLLTWLLFQVNLRKSLFKIATFVAYLVCFFCVLQGIMPSDQVSAARRHLETVIGTANVGKVT